MKDQIIAIAKEWQISDLAAKRELIKKIVKTGSPEGLKLLVQIFSRDQDIELRKAARKAYNVLHKYCYGNEASEDSEEVAVVDISSILQDLQSQDPELEQRALLLCDEQPAPEVLEYLRANYEVFYDNRVKATLVKVIGRARAVSDIPIIYKFLDDENPRVRANAIEALEQINHPNTYIIFVQWLSDSDNRVKANCIKALRRIGRDSVNRILEDMLNSEYTAYRESALYVLSMFPGTAALNLVKDFLAHEIDQVLLERAVYLLYEFVQKQVPGASELYAEYYQKAGYESAEIEHYEGGHADEVYADAILEDIFSDDINSVFKALAKILENKYIDYAPNLIELLHYRQNDYRVASYILRILGELHLADYLPEILPFLQSEDTRTRANAVEAIGCLNVGLDYLVPFLNDTNNRVRANAVVALAGKNVVDVSYAVLDMAASHDGFLRKSALFAIREIKNSIFVPALAKMLKDKDEYIRSQALEVLQFYEICGITEATQILKEGGFSIY